MSVNNHARDLIQRRAANFCAVLRNLQKTPLARKMPPIGRNIDNLIHWLPRRKTQIAKALIILQFFQITKSI